MQLKKQDQKKKWTALVAGWQAQVDRARAQQAQSGQPATDSGSDKNAPARSVTPRRGFLEGHRRENVELRFTRKLGTRPEVSLPASDSASKIYVHEVSLPAGVAAANSRLLKGSEQTVIDRTQKLYKCSKVPLVLKPFCEYLSNTTKKRISTPNTLNSVLHFASVVTLVVAQIVLLGTYLLALAPRDRATKAFFQELHQVANREVQQDTSETAVQQRADKREALIENWQRKVQTFSAMYATGLTIYLLLMAAFASTTGAYFWTRRPQDPWWGWLNWSKSARDAWAAIRGKGNLMSASSTNGRTPISVMSFRSRDED
ncbi:MAG: hypothetical protein ACAI35_01960 [Candidatus Methylacidiphilales bacterium]|nr:hypothetical protein [Candidatus Methylacidiphilales bacterium]